MKKAFSCYIYSLMKEILLNQEQEKAANHKEGPLLILAGAGAGKTKTLTERIINLMKEGIPGSQILAVTFTNKAAAEMRERVAIRLANLNFPFALPEIRTFHALGVLFIREEHMHFGLSKNFTIADESDAISMIKEALREQNLDPKQFEPRKIKNIISRQKGEGVTYDKFASNGGGYLERVVGDIWERYERILKSEQNLDFDDLLLKMLILLKENEIVRNRWQERFKYIHIDEYQDTNEVQYRIARILADKHHNICVVGDSDQNIYSWRGANIKNILSFERDYPESTVILLEQNYRSTKNILSAANSVIKKNSLRHDKNLFTENKKGEEISVYVAYDESDESKFVAETALELIDKGVRPEEIAVLYRANFQSRAIEEACLEYKLPYTVLGVRFFERKEVKDILSYIRGAQNKESLSDIKRIINTPARGIGKVTIAKYFAGQKDSLPAGTQKKINEFEELLEKIGNACEELPPSGVVRFVIEETGLKKMLKESKTEEDLERIENMEELVTLAMRYDEIDGGLMKLIEDAALAGDQDSLSHEKKDKKQGVRLMTVHASKGLEFEYVFIVGLEQDLFPHSRGTTSKEDAEEERRLMYVALTRAREKLYLTHATVRTIFGQRQIAIPSEFLDDMPDDIIKAEQYRGQSIKTIYI